MLKSLQAGRALAAMAVLAFHLSSAFGDPRYGGRPIGRAFTHHGNLGVDFFFVLSGFIILNAHLKDVSQPGRWANYARKRFTRVFPVYWVCLILFCGFLGVQQAAGLPHVAQIPSGIMQWLSAVTLLRFSSHAPPLLVAWTLYHEIAFYLLFSLLILNRLVGALALGLWMAVCLALYHFSGTEASALEAYTSAYNLEFLIGMAAYGLYRLGRWPWLYLAGGVATLVGAYVLADGFGHLEHLLFGLGFGLAIVGATVAERRGQFPTPRWLVWVGGASYTLYLIHVPVSGVVLKGVQAAHLEGLPAALLWAGVFVATVGVALAGWELEKWLKKPGRFGGKRADLAVSSASS